MRIFKRDSEPEVVEKIADRAIRKYMKKQTGKPPVDPTRYSSTGGGSFGTGGGTGVSIDITLWFNAYGIGSVPSVPTYIQRSRVNAVGGVHLYDASGASAVQIRLNLANDPLYCLVL